MKVIKYFSNWNFGCYKVDDKILSYPNDLNVKIKDNVFLESYILNGEDYDHGHKTNWTVNALRTYAIVDNEKYYKTFNELEIEDYFFNELMNKEIFKYK